MDLSKETLEFRKKNKRCLICGDTLDENYNCVSNPYHTDEPS